MSRSIWKIPYISNIVFRNAFLTNRKVINLFQRNSIISNLYVDRRVRIYNGKHFVSYLVKPGMIGQKFGEFSITKVLGSAISLSMSLKAKRKKKSKKAK